MTKCTGQVLYNTSMEVIYIDSLFFINLAADYFLCLLAARICGLSLKRGRYLLSALAGAVYSVLIFLPGLGFLASPSLKLCAGILICALAYGGERHPLKCSGVFFAVSAAFGGALWAMGLSGGLSTGFAGISAKLLMSSFALCYSLGLLIFRCRGKVQDRKRVKVKLSFLGENTDFTALVDTGNSLCDPVTGAPVMLVCPQALKPVLHEDSELFEALSPVELIELSEDVPRLKGKLRLIPYRALGGSGMLPVFRPDSVEIDGRVEKGMLAAVSPNAGGEDFDALI